MTVVDISGAGTPGSDVKNESLYCKMIEHVTDGIYTTRNGIFVYVNRQMARMFEYAIDEMIGMEAWNLAAPEKRESVKATMYQMVMQKNSTPVEVDCITKTGKRITVEIRYSGVVDNNMDFGIVINITERKQIEEELKKAIRKAEENDRLKSAFLANMSHEIRTPMNAIIGFSTLLNKRILNDEKRNEYLGYITDSCQQLLVLVDDILDISKLETGQLHITLNKVNVNHLLNDIFSVFAEKAGAVGLELILDPGLSDEFAFVTTDRVRLRQVLYNLIGNAFKFTKKGSIKIGYIAEAEKLKFYVNDTGCGIPPEHAERIFDRFRQVDNSLERNHNGAGLGLSICKGLMDLLHGAIWCESVPEDSQPGIQGGSTFYFTLPYSPVQTANSQ